MPHRVASGDAPPKNLTISIPTFKVAFEARNLALSLSAQAAPSLVASSETSRYQDFERHHNRLYADESARPAPA
jgi:hypothetical protein